MLNTTTNLWEKIRKTKIDSVFCGKIVHGKITFKIKKISIASAVSIYNTSFK